MLICRYIDFAAAAAKSLQLCPTLCDPIDGSPPGSPIPGILQARSGKSPGEGMATHSSVLAWRIPGTEELGGLPSVGLHRVGHNCSDLAAAAAGYITY